MPSITEVEGGVVYLLTSPSGRQYVGQTWNFDQRMAQYKRKCTTKSAVISAIEKHGWDNFVVVIIACGIQTQDALDATEKAFIALLDTMSPYGYNLKSGGIGGKHSAETRERIGAGNLGKKVSDETRARMSESHKGHRHSSETRAKISAGNRGKVMSPETRAKMSAASKGKPKSPEHRAKLSAALTGRTRIKHKQTASTQTTLL